MSASDSEDTVPADVRWTDGALKRMERAPIFLRGMVRRLAEKKGRELGYEEITEEILEQFKGQMMGRMGGEAGMASAVEEMADGRLPWTAAAKERLNTVPGFMRAMTKQIAEEIAKERGHLEVNVELFEKVEALGDLHEEGGLSLEWTKEELALLQDKLKQSPPIALEFVTDMLKRDT